MAIAAPTLVQPVFLQDMRLNQQWTLLRDAPIKEGEVLPAALDAISCLAEGDRHLTGDQLLQRAEDLGVCLGQRHAEALQICPEVIPEVPDYCSFLFPETVLEDEKKQRYISSLRRYGAGRWIISFRFLRFGFSAFDYFLVPRRFLVGRVQ